MDELSTYKKMYYHLFNAVTDALSELENRNYGTAAARLKKAQQDTEELYLCAPGEAEKSST